MYHFDADGTGVLSMHNDTALFQEFSGKEEYSNILEYGFYICQLATVYAMYTYEGKEHV